MRVLEMLEVFLIYPQKNSLKVIKVPLFNSFAKVDKKIMGKNYQITIIITPAKKNKNNGHISSHV